MEFLQIIRDIRTRIQNGESYTDNEEKIINYCNKYLVQYLYNEDFIMVSCKRKISIIDDIFIYCDNIIISIDKFDIVSMSRPLFNYNYKRSELIQKNIDDYVIYEVIEGTVFNMYFSKFSDKWCISTKRIIDASDVYWYGNKTYNELINSIAEKIDNFKWSNLDKNKCYTMGFKHNSTHLFNDTEKLWLIATTDISEINKTLDITTLLSHIRYDDQIGLMCHKVVKLSFEEIFENADKAFEKRREGINYGYILRGNDNCDVKLRHIFVESSLLMNIRKILYNRQLSDIYNYNNKIIMRTYIPIYYYFNEKRDIFVKLFPTLKGMHNDIDFIINYSVNAILNKFVVKTTANEIIRQKMNVFVEICVKLLNDANYIDYRNEKMKKHTIDFLGRNKILISYIYNLLKD